MFIDEAKIFVKAGDGGNGCVSFRRERNIPRGGPNGGDGGKGGDVTIEASSDLSTLIDFQYRSHFKSERGEHGKGKNRHGRDGDDLIIRVPPGTVVKKVLENVVVRFIAQRVKESEETVIADLINPGQQVIVATGGKGGRGNAAFKSATNRAPRIAEKGESGKEVALRLELKLIADIGFIGYPNAGKSTLLSKLSNARPKVASYPFTTLEPYLGVMEGNLRKIILADLPGLIEGAHEGKGLGDKFLRHAERTKGILHIVDLSGYEGRTPLENFEIINNELESYNLDFKNRIQLIVANKIDLEEAKNNLSDFSRALSKRGYRVIPVSGITGEGLDDLKKEIFAVFATETQKRL